MSNDAAGIMFDTAPSPLPPQLLERRAMTSTSSNAPVPTNSPNAATPTVPNNGTTPATTLMTSTSVPTSTALPVPFDQSLSNNVSSSCDRFFDSFLADPAFVNCTPLSLLLGTSVSFFRAQRAPAQLNQILDASCKVAFPQCSALMSKLGRQIQESGSCGDDYQKQNPTVLRAYTGFITYEPMYHAGCLRQQSNSSSSSSSTSGKASNSTTSSYCFTDAATNNASFQDNYNYYLPLGVQLPPDVKPTCSQCSRDTMALFAASASNKSQPLSVTYNPAARLVNGACGNNFVKADVQASSAAGAATLAGQSGVLTAVTLAVVLWNMTI